MRGSNDKKTERLVFIVSGSIGDCKPQCGKKQWELAARLPRVRRRLRPGLVPPNARQARGRRPSHLSRPSLGVAARLLDRSGDDCGSHWTPGVECQLPCGAGFGVIGAERGLEGGEG